MSEAFVQDGGDARLEELAREGARLDGAFAERDEATRVAFARQLDALLVKVGRGRGAVDLAIGDRLDELAAGDRAIALGYASVGDYARERLGLAASTAQKMARLARRLRDAPLLREAVRSGAVSVRQAEAVLPLARGEAEAWWVTRARNETVRALKAAVKESAGAAPAGEEDQPFVRFGVEVDAAQRAVIDEALEVAGAVLGEGASEWERIQALGEEFLGAHPEGDGEASVCAEEPLEDWMDPAREWLERESGNWEFLAQLDPVPVPAPLPDAHADAGILHEDLLRLAELRARWDEVFGHVAMLFVRMRAFRLLRFASFDHYAEERLGMSGRAVEQRAALERRLLELPTLRRALSERQISYEKARLIARHADGQSVERFIERARGLTCVALRDELEGAEKRQICARGRIEVVVPLRVRTLLLHTLDAARRVAGEWISSGECLARVARHFLDVWKPAVERRGSTRNRVLERDRGRCQVPGCSRAAAHAHHIAFRSAGGGNEPSNLVSLCAAHHLRGVHMGCVRVWGTAPDGLHWELGVRQGRPPIAVYGPGRQ